jgi:hypothetical protein
LELHVRQLADLTGSLTEDLSSPFKNHLCTISVSALAPTTLVKQYSCLTLEEKTLPLPMGVLSVTFLQMTISSSLRTPADVAVSAIATNAEQHISMIMNADIRKKMVCFIGRLP